MSLPIFTKFRSAGIALLIGALASGLTTGCAGESDGGPGPSNGPRQPAPDEAAFLSLVGDANLFVEPMSTRQLQVKYHDQSGAPLAGEIHFAIDGNGVGASLSAAKAVTDAQGVAKINLVAGNEGAFRIKVTAELATGVDWRVSVTRAVAPTPPLSLLGDFRTESTLDIGGGLPGTVGTVVRTLDDLTDGPNDPATFLIDAAVNQIGSSTIRSAVNFVRPGLDSMLNDFISDNSPTFVSKMLQVSRDFSNVARRFGLVSKLSISNGVSIDGNIQLKHKLEGVFFTIGGVKKTFMFSAMGITPTEVTVPAQVMGESKIVLGQHQFPFSYGQVLLVALNQAIIPAIDPTAHNIGELISHQVNCASIAVEIANFVGIGGTSLYEGACRTGITAVGGLIEDQIRRIDSTATTLTLKGDADIMDANTDRVVEAFQGGLWEGSMTMAGSTSMLVRPNNKFTAVKMAGATP